MLNQYIFKGHMQKWSILFYLYINNFQIYSRIKIIENSIGLCKGVTQTYYFMILLVSFLFLDLLQRKLFIAANNTIHIRSWLFLQVSRGHSRYTVGNFRILCSNCENLCPSLRIVCVVGVKARMLLFSNNVPFLLINYCTTRENTNVCVQILIHMTLCTFIKFIDNIQNFWIFLE